MLPAIEDLDPMIEAADKRPDIDAISYAAGVMELYRFLRTKPKPVPEEIIDTDVVYEPPPRPPRVFGPPINLELRYDIPYPAMRRFRCWPSNWDEVRLAVLSEWEPGGSVVVDCHRLAKSLLWGLSAKGWKGSTREREDLTYRVWRIR